MQPSNAQSSICPRSKLCGDWSAHGRCSARKAARVFLARAGAQGLGITTRKAAEGTRAQFGAANLVTNALIQTHKRLTWPFPHLLAPKYLPSAPIPVLLIDASSMWAWWIKPKRRRGSQVRFLLLPGVRGEWPARQVHVPQADGVRDRHLPRPLCCSRHERGHPCDVPEGRAVRAGWWGSLWPAQLKVPEMSLFAPKNTHTDLNGRLSNTPPTANKAP